MAGPAGVSSVHSAARPRVRGSSLTPKVRGYSDPIGDQERHPLFQLGVTQGH